MSNANSKFMEFEDLSDITRSRWRVSVKCKYNRARESTGGPSLRSPSCVLFTLRLGHSYNGAIGAGSFAIHAVSSRLDQLPL